MSSSSDLGGWIYMDSDGDMRGAAPLSPTQLRILSNNANHAADEDAQVLVCETALNGRARTVDSSGYRLVALWSNLPVRLKSNGIPYPIRVRLYSSTGSATSASVVLAVTPTRNYSVVFSDASTVRTSYAGSATGTATNSAGFLSLTFNSGTGLLEPDGTRRTGHSVPVSVGSSSRGAVIEHTVDLSFWGKTSSGSTSLSVGQLYAAQYYKV